MVGETNNSNDESLAALSRACGADAVQGSGQGARASYFLKCPDRRSHAEGGDGRSWAEADLFWRRAKNASGREVIPENSVAVVYGTAFDLRSEPKKGVS